MKKVIKWVFGAILIILIIQAVFVVVPYTISTFNEQKDIRNSYNQKVQEKKVIMNEFTSCLTSSLNISNTNAEYFKENIQIIMDNRQDGIGLLNVIIPTNIEYATNIANNKIGVLIT